MSYEIHTELGDYFERFIAQEIAQGRYQSAKEVIRAALELLAKKRKGESLLKEALEAGAQSGYVENVNIDSFLEDMHSKYGDTL